MHKFFIAITALLAPATVAWGQGIDRQVVATAEDATVYIKIKAGRMQGSGSGFVMRVTGDTVLVMTNRHVAAPDADELPPGAEMKLSVVFRSGNPRQQELPARLVAFDERELHDLAVLEVKGVNSPPTPISATPPLAETDLYNTMPVFALGYPLGKMIQGVVDSHAENPAGTVTPTTISALRRDDANRLARIQLAGGSIIEGNSGGPLIDAKGRLAGVVVARIRGEAVGFAVPPNIVTTFLAGDVGSHNAQLVEYKGNAQIKLSVRLVDPLARLKTVAIRYARPAGNAAKPQADANGNYARLENGTDVPLAIGQGVAGAQLSVPVASAGERKLTVQFVLTDLAGKLKYSKPVPWDLPERPGPIIGPEEDKPRTLAKWSCEVNRGEGVKIVNKVGVTTIDTPGEAPMVNAPQYQLFNAPSALVRVDGDFVAQVKVTNDFDPGSDQVTLPNGKKPGMSFQGAGLLVWQDEKNYLRLERCKGSDGGVHQIHRVLVEMYKGGKEVGIHYSKNLPALPLRLEVRRKGASFQLLFELPNVGMAIFQEMALDFDKEVLVGVSAANLSMHPFQAKFEEFSLQGADGQSVEVKPVSLSRLDGGPVQRSDGVWVMEGATMRVLKTMGQGSAKAQTHMDKYQGKWTDNRQLLWSGGHSGDALILDLPIDVEGKYEIKGKFTIAPDYGKTMFELDDTRLGKTYDFYHKEMKPASWMSLGTMSLKKGRHKFRVTLMGKNASSSAYSFGLDELQLVPAVDAKKKK